MLFLEALKVLLAFDYLMLLITWVELPGAEFPFAETSCQIIQLAEFVLKGCVSPVEAIKHLSKTGQVCFCRKGILFYAKAWRIGVILTSPTFCESESIEVRLFYVNLSETSSSVQCLHSSRINVELFFSLFIRGCSDLLARHFPTILEIFKLICNIIQFSV